jgi:hypothetical protein
VSHRQFNDVLVFRFANYAKGLAVALDFKVSHVAAHALARQIPGKFYFHGSCRVGCKSMKQLLFQLVQCVTVSFKSVALFSALLEW